MKILVSKNKDKIIVSCNGKKLVIDNNENLFNELIGLSKEEITEWYKMKK